MLRKLINSIINLFIKLDNQYTDTAPLVLKPVSPVKVEEKWWVSLGLPQLIPGVDMWVGVANCEWIKFMAQFYGEKEIAGKDKNNSKITQFFKWAVGKIYPDETMWCQAAVVGSLKQTGYDKNVKDTLWAADGKEFGDACGEEPGCIVGFYSAAANSGIHIAFAIYWTSTHVWAFGGNQNNMFCLQKRDKRDVRFKRMPKRKA